MKTILTHYIIVRRDLPLGVALAQVAHAAGESFYKLTGRSLTKAPAMGLEDVGGTPTDPATFDAHRTIVVVLGARNEHRLLKLERTLTSCGVAHVAIREPDEPWNGQLMAIGLVPGDREVLSGLFRDYQTLRELDGR